MTIANPDMPASRLFDEIYTCWLAQFERAGNALRYRQMSCIIRPLYTPVRW